MHILYRTLPTGLGLVLTAHGPTYSLTQGWPFDDDGSLRRQRYFASDSEWILPGTYGYDGEPVDKTPLHYGEHGVLLDGPKWLMMQQAYELRRIATDYLNAGKE